MQNVDEIYHKRDNLKHVIKINGTKYEVFGNRRTEDFHSFYHCEICDPDLKRFIPRVVKIPGEHDLLICLNCLNNMVKAIETSITYECKKGGLLNNVNQIRKGGY